MLNLISISFSLKDETRELALPFIEDWYDTDKKHVIQATSGSTGTPKLIRIKKNQMRASARMTGEFFNLSACENALLCISPEYIGGKMMIVRALEFKLKLYTAPISANPIEVLDLPIDFAAMVPLQVQTILEQNPEKLNLIRYLIIGGAPVSRQLEKQLLEYSCEAYSTFGMTETISHIALKRLNNTNAPFIGIGESSFSTRDGQLTVNSPELGISNLVTNDVVEIIHPQAFLWKGRSDHVINTGGVKVFPEQIEQKLSSHFQHGDYFITSVPDERFGQCVVAIILKDKISKEELMSSCGVLLEKYEQPKKVYVAGHFVYLANNKLDRTGTLRELGYRA